MAEIDDGEPATVEAVVTKTISEPDVYLFAGLTGDFDRVHLDEEWCKRSSLGRRICHGALLVGLMSAASTQALRNLGSVALSSGYDQLRFLEPVYLGETVTVTFSAPAPTGGAERLVGDVRVTNQRGELVAVAQHVIRILE